MTRLRTILLALVIGLVPAIGSLMPSPALAGTLGVGNGEVGSCGVMALEYVIEEQAKDGDVVVFLCPTPSLRFFDIITIDKDITIDGSNLSGSQITLKGGEENGSSPDQLFLIAEGAEVTLRNLTFTLGITPEGNGGAIVNLGTLHVKNSVFNKNHAGGAGGAIYSTGTLEVSNSIFTENSAVEDGGAIDSHGPTTIVGSTFDDNLVTGLDAGTTGGAIFNDATMTVSQSTFTNNMAVHGGAIRNSGALKITQSRFDENITLSETGSGDGGAIDNLGALEISQSTFIGNIAEDVGGAINHWSGTLSITSSTLQGNKAASGSTIMVSGTSDQTVLRWSTIVKPGATTSALYLGTNVTLEGVILAGPGDNCSGVSDATIDSHTISDDESCDLDTSTGSLANTDPKLQGPAGADVGGVNQTYFGLEEGSPAIDAGGSGCDIVPEGEEGPAVDQIGNSRPTDDTCDIGAIEASYLNNAAPTIDSIDVPDTVQEGDAASISVVAHDDDGDEGQLTYSFDCTNDGSWEIGGASNPSASCTYADDGNPEIKVAVSDGTKVTSKTISITVTNVAPTIMSFTADPNLATINQPVKLSASADDPGDDLITYHYDCGGGDFDPATTSCTFAESGAYTVTVYAQDDGQAQSQTSSLQVVVSAPPVITRVDVPSSAGEGKTVTISVRASDDDGDALTYAIDCDTSDGVAPGFTAESSEDCSYPENGNYSGQVQVSDGTHTVSQPFDITITNVAPTVTGVLADPNPAMPNQAVTLQMTATDVPADMVAFSYDCGNVTGSRTDFTSSASGVFSTTASCTYTELGRYTVRVTAVDQNEGASAPFTIDVMIADPIDLCANRWNGSLRLPSGDCSSSELLVAVPSDPAPVICANGWNGDARYSPSRVCNGSETRHEARGDNSIPICVNRWNGSLRVSEVCSSSEWSDAI